MSAENSIAAQASINQPAPAADTKTAPAATPPQAPRTFKVKVDGAEIDVPESELVTNYQLRKASDQKMNEAKKMYDQAAEVLRVMTSDTKRALQIAGIDPYKFANEIAMQQVEDEMLSPEQKELRDAKAQLQKFNDEKKATEEAAKKAEVDAVAAKYVGDLEAKIQAAVTASGLPDKGPSGARTYMRVGQYMAQLFEQGYNNVEPSDVIDMVIKDYEADFRSLLGSDNEERIIKILGEEGLTRLGKIQTKRLQSSLKTPGEKQTSKSNQPNVQKKPGKKEKQKDPGDFFERIRSQHGV